MGDSWDVGRVVSTAGQAAPRKQLRYGKPVVALLATDPSVDLSCCDRCRPTKTCHGRGGQHSSCQRSHPAYQSHDRQVTLGPERKQAVVGQVHLEVPGTRL